MPKRLDEMVGTPPDKRLPFVCRRYKPKKITSSDIERLLKLTRENKKAFSRYPSWMFEGLIEFIKNTTFHDMEGRPTGDESKNSFAATELETALSFQEERHQIEYLIHRYMFAEYPLKKIVNDFPIIVAVEPTSLCNLRCKMCFQADASYFNRDNPKMGYMEFELYKRIIDEMADNQPCGLVLASRGEPTLHKEFTDMVSYATGKGIIDVKLNTNVTGLTDSRIRRLLEAEPTTIVFSVDAGNKQEFEAIRIGANFEKVVDNIKKFNAIRKRDFPNTSTRTRISMTVFRTTQNIKEAENVWSPLVDEFASHSANYFLDIYDHPVLPEETHHCKYLWERVSIWWNGEVNPCDMDYKSHLSLGTVDKDHSVKSIWLGEKMSKMRQAHGSGHKNDYFPCNQCYGSGS